MAEQIHARTFPLKSDFHLPKNFFCFCFNESPLKVIKYAFYFMLKALFVLEIFKFLPWLFGYVEKRLDKKTKVNFKIYGVTDWTKNNYSTCIVQFLVRSNDNQAKKLGHVTEYNMRSIFLEIHTQNEKLVPDSLIKIKTEHVSGSIVWNVIKFIFVVCLSGCYQNISALTCWPLAFALYKAFSKNKN